MKSELPHRAVNMWLLTAAIPAILSVTGRSGYLGILAGALVCGGVCMAVRVYGSGKVPRWICAAELLWLIVFLGAVAKESGACWEGQPIAVPGILLALAALLSCRGSAGASRAGAALLWLVLPVLGIVALAGITNVNPQWIRDEFHAPEGTLLALLLLPCLPVFLPVTEIKKGKWLCWVPALVAVAASLLLEGTEGGPVAGNGFYEFSKGISLLGIAERFEALVACMLTLGWFALFSMILSAVHHLSGQFCAQYAGWSVWISAAAAAGLMCILPKEGDWVAIGTLIFWVFLPLATQGLVVRKKL